jgi:undecaprenyl-diphosphatase
VNPFDHSIVLFVNGFAHRSVPFDNFVDYIGSDPFLTAGIVMALFWWAWSQPGENRDRNRETLIFSLVASVLAGFLARGFAVMLPFRLRPIHDPQLHLNLPYGFDPTTLMGWSSFPSDHAAIYFCLAIGIWIVSKRLGTIALIDAAFVVCLPRLYDGIHYPTDLIAGALIGIFAISLAKIDHIRQSVSKPAWSWLHAHPSSFYAAVFLCTIEIGTGFQTLRTIVRTALHLFQSNGFALR